MGGEISQIICQEEARSLLAIQKGQKQNSEPLKEQRSDYLEHVPTNFADLHRLWQPQQISKCQTAAEPKCKAAPPSSDSLIQELGEERLSHVPKSLMPSELASLSYDYVPEHKIVIFPPLAINSEVIESFSEGCNIEKEPQKESLHLHHMPRQEAGVLSVVKKLPAALSEDVVKSGPSSEMPQTISEHVTIKSVAEMNIQKTSDSLTVKKLPVSSSAQVLLLSNKEQQITVSPVAKQLQALNCCDKPLFIRHCLPVFLSELKNSSSVDCGEGNGLISILSAYSPSLSSLANFASSQVFKEMSLNPQKQSRVSIVLNGLASQVFDPGKKDDNPHSLACQYSRMTKDFF